MDYMDSDVHCPQKAIKLNYSVTQSSLHVCVCVWALAFTITALKTDDSGGTWSDFEFEETYHISHPYGQDMGYLSYYDRWIGEN